MPRNIAWRLEAALELVRNDQSKIYEQAAKGFERQKEHPPIVEPKILWPPNFRKKERKGS